MTAAATLFSGIGAPELAMPGWDWRWAAETDRFASAVHDQHFGVANLGDVTAPDFVERSLAHGRPDVLVFGPPCQSFSIAGKRGGLDDARGNLALTALDVVARVGATWIVLENVPGLLSSAEGRDFGTILGAMEKRGYGWAYRVLNAQYFGVPQRRRRVFVVGHLGDWRRAAAVLFEPESLSGHPPPGREAREGIARPVASCAEGGSGYRLDADHADDLITHPLLGKPNSSHDHTMETYVSHTVNGHGGSGRSDGESETFLPVCVAEYDDSMGVTPTLARNASRRCHGAAAPIVAMAENQRGELREMSVVAALNTGGGKPGSGYPGVVYRTTSVDDGQLAVRRLTPRECERLQGMPDDHTAITYRGKPAADGPRYRAIGNAMAVPVMRWILERIETSQNNA